MNDQPNTDAEVVPESPQEFHAQAVAGCKSKLRGVSLRPNPAPTEPPNPPQPGQQHAAGDLSRAGTTPAVPPLSVEEVASLLGADETVHCQSEEEAVKIFRKRHSTPTALPLALALSDMAEAELSRSPISDDIRVARCRVGMESLMESLCEEAPNIYAGVFGVAVEESIEILDSVIRNWFKSPTPQADRWGREHCGVSNPCTECHGFGMVGAGPAGCGRCGGSGAEPL